MHYAPLSEAKRWGNAPFGNHEGHDFFRDGGEVAHAGRRMIKSPESRNDPSLGDSDAAKTSRTLGDPALN